MARTLSGHSNPMIMDCLTRSVMCGSGVRTPIARLQRTTSKGRTSRARMASFLTSYCECFEVVRSPILRHSSAWPHAIECGQKKAT